MEQGEAFLTTRSEEETAYIGMVLGKWIKEPLVIALHGGLGTGKTVLVRGAAAGLGVTEMVTSPSFVLLKIYAGRLPVYHFDFYRLDEDVSLDDLGFDEYLPGEGVAFVEWAENLPGIIPPQRLEITIERFFDHGGEGRRIWFNPHGEESAWLVARLIEGISWRVDGSLKMLPQSLFSLEFLGRLGWNC
ncbi:MAG: tRNA (adenosine(37)-N6)-threonylcarbamoyltransferase complex ATPase subunit type 1 TsaE [Dethiobacteria bacterium]|jgi:tRNA threonylcarbamoyladenosine biosynthesis protein TsaE|nr:tRNA (adenosine(37)-N6)-threonylcarbamoyltransferase complex ATPase subunit type 1 TsaE [Bacillota bacterium]NMD32421.1 tRNA (adenosine(37)-N6)-threonylcarbamoyltransferase complex ATPase subunit type 1 TsaE [Bacillota bacterium]HOB28283.1 tRNA (adenosine(37)-N6)-threonylcarbamoyltransferase complex ATPase subunit type 1 TsaE [Bacillota bacterium]HPZ42223.1 tRNA (adenosine(37)-N6)-threonylcarbamoyltransferase complex ATPase subunit type 1 TsaE [Bacillota bacterium]HQD53036.1 tRNA (adenosine(